MTPDNTPGQTPPFTAEDLTAFALGELDPVGDTHRAIAAALKQDPAIAAEIDAIKHSAAAVRDALAHEPVPATSGSGILPVEAPHHRQDACATNSSQAKTKPPLFARPALLAAGFALAAGAAITAIHLVQPSPGNLDETAHLTPAADTPRGLDAIHAALQTPITASFQNATLSEVFDTVAHQTHADLAVDWPALEARGIARDTAFTFDADNLPARDLLSLALAACWQELPHPDPAVWTVTTTQVRVEPRSAVVQRAFDQAQVVLAANNTTRANMTPSQLTLANHPAWQQPGAVTEVMKLQQEEARQRAEQERIAEENRLAEIERQERMRIQLAEDTVQQAEVAMAEQRYAFAMLLFSEAIELDPTNPAIAEKLTEARTECWLALHPSIADTDPEGEIFLARRETIARFEQSVSHAIQALSSDRYAEAHDAMIEARTLLNINRSSFSEQELIDLTARAAEMQRRISEFEQVNQALRLAQAEHAQLQAESQSRATAERRRTEQAQHRLHNAQQLHAQGRMTEARIEMAAAQFIDPSLALGVRANTATYGSRSFDGSIQQALTGLTAANDRLTATLSSQGPSGVTRNLGWEFQAGTQTAQAEEHLRRQLDVMRSNQQIVNDEATLPAELGEAVIPYDELLVTPHDWPELGDDFELESAVGVALASRDRETIELRREIDRVRSLGDNATPADRQRLEELAQRLRLEAVARHMESPAIDPHQLNRDTYALVNDNPFHTGFNDPLSTFSVDVDTAAYALVRRQVMQQNQSPVPGAVRIEELVNYFDYSYTAPVVEPELLDGGVVTQASLERLAADDDTFAPFATHVEVADCPWADGHQLVRIGVKGMEVAQEDRAAAHLTFLLDVSGSMNRANKLPLVVESMKMLLSQLNPDDHVSIVVYAGAAGVVLEHAAAADTAAIEDALNKLKAGGSTAGGEGIQLAYDIADRHFVDGGVNRVILCTDGDFNVGISDREALVELIKERANPAPDDSGQTRGVYLSVLGFGMGNLNDNMMEPLTNAGNGNYAYIDSAAEAHKVMVEQVGGTLVAIAKDVKVQVEFNPARVLAYRLIGYENRILAHEDFENDTVDAGDIGAGHTVTALYEVVPFPDEGLGDDERVMEVKRQIEALDEALAFSTSVLENTPLTDEQYRKLMGSVAMLQQQRAVAAAMQATVKHRPGSAIGEGPAGIDLRYRRGAAIVDDLDELMVVNLRYKPVDAPAEQGTSRLIQTVVAPDALPFAEASADTRFAAAVAGYGMVLRHSPHRGDADFTWVLDTAGGALGEDANGYRAGFVALVERSAQLRPEDAEKQRNVIAPR